ncbi:MAG: hypothetical protein CVV42_19320 [Candidatus Riflebacteria bacterium HGW-Riflebacteria-2]|jgi:prepilin-type N-terminal cleavage/methylation domain-containing protein|nr:MAG: hypothetical protein CVV42_19320 [Candidatus Riflebacteria bacterium HGW-Riflebacteria-2]
MTKKAGFTVVELMIAIVIFAVVVVIAFSFLSGFRRQSVKGTSMLDSTETLNDIYNSLQQDMLKAKLFEVRDPNNDLIQAKAAAYFDGAAAAPDYASCTLILTLSDGSTVKYCQEGDSLLRQETEKKYLGEHRIQRAAFCPVKSVSASGETLFDLLLVEIEAQPATARPDERHKAIKMSFFVTPPL